MSWLVFQGATNASGQSVGLNGQTSTPIAMAQGEIPDITDAADDETTILKMVWGGNALGKLVVVLLILLSLLSTYFVIEHFLTITRGRVIPDLSLIHI